MSWLGDLGSVIGTIFHYFTSPLSAVWSLIFNNILGNPSNPNSPLGFLMQTLTGQLNPVDAGAVEKFYLVLAPSSLALLSLFAGAKILQGLKKGEASGVVVAMDVLPKWVVMAILLAPGTNIAYNLFGFVVGSMSKIGAAMTGALLGVTTAGDAGKSLASLVTTDVITAVVAFVTPADPMAPLIVVFGLALAALLVYLIGLMIMRTVVLIFCLTLLPIALPIAMYDPQNAFYRWWLGSALGALAAQIIGGAGFAITLGLALDSPGVGPIKAVTTVAVMTMGLVFTTKAVRAAESGTMAGAGIGIGGLVEVGALGPRAVSNVLGSRIGAGTVSGTFTRLGRARLAGGGGAGGGGGGNGGGGGGLGLSAGPRGMLGIAFPRHNAFADAVGVGAGTLAGAYGGIRRPQSEERRGQSMVFGAGAGYRMAMGTASTEDSSRAFVATRAGQATAARFEEHWKRLEPALEHRTEEERTTARREFESIRENAAGHGFANAMDRPHPARVGRAARLTQDQSAHVEAQLRAHEAKWSRPSR